MSRKIWSIAVAFLFIVCIATMANAQGNGNQGQNPGNGNQGQNPGNGNQGQNPGNGNQGQNPGNGNQGQNPGNGNQGQNPGNGNQGQNPGNGNQGEDPGNGNRRVTPNGNSSRRAPDGMTPAEESTCDDLKYGTPGLYGLCIAFCEAHEPCAPDFSLDDPISVCKQRDQRILANYNRKKNDGDPDMPCLPSAGEDPETACPCWSQDQIASFPYSWTLSGVQGSYNWCRSDAPWENEDDEDCLDINNVIQENVTLEDETTVYIDFRAIDLGCGDYVCQAWLGCDQETCPEGFNTDEFSLTISEDEYNNCSAQIVEAETYCN